MSARPIEVQKPTLVFVGGGPRTVSLMERIAANADLIPAGGVDVHIVDPFPVGGGRIWRRNQSPLLWMNSVAKDVTVFTDESVMCAGPIVPGPPLDQWVAGVGRQVLIDNGLRGAADAFKADDFASREIQSLYLSWTFESVLSSLPASVTVTRHLQRAVSVRDVLLPGGSPDGTSGGTSDGTSTAQQEVRLADGTVLTADLVVLAQGYLDRHPTRAEKELSAAASEHDLVYLPPGYTADVDLSGLQPGADVLVRGFGLAFIDVMVLVFEGRGGRFVESGTADVVGGTSGGLIYLRGGAEPVLHVGSRRGVPYHAKLGYSLGSAAPVPPVYFTPAALESFGPDHPADFRTQLWPLIVKELTAVHYRRLFEFHAERTLVGWPEFSAVLDRTDPAAVAGEEFATYVASAVPDPADRFDLAAIDRPLAGREFADHAALADALVGEISADLARRADPAYSPDHAVFNGLLTVYGVLAGAVVAGRISAQGRVQHVEGAFHGLFSFLASGPPPRRLHELLALHRAGFIHFVGPDMQVRVENGRFVGSSPAVAGTVEADALIDARLPRPDVRAASDPIIARLLADGEIAAEDLVAEDGSSLGGGQLLADATCRAVRGDRSVHPTRFLLGPSVSGSAGSAGFARPGFNGAGFRQNDEVARELLRLSAARAAALPAVPVPPVPPVPTVPTVPTVQDVDISAHLKESESSHAR